MRIALLFIFVDEILGTYFGSLLAGGERKLFRIKFKQFMEAGEICNIEFTLYKKDGTSIPVTFVGCITIFGHFSHIFLSHIRLFFVPCISERLACFA